MPINRIALVGTGGRALSFAEPIVRTYAANNELAAMLDASPARLAYYNEIITTRWGAPAVPIYAPADFARMLREQRVDTVLVCSKDSTHHGYIVPALEAGCDVITEKPMVISAAQCADVAAAVARTGRRVQVAFNYRWAPFRTKVRELIASGTIGRVRSVNLEYLLDTCHGADYFRRWHAEMAESGGLLVHKSTHHFDLVNWWLDAIPAQVFAAGDLVYYGRANALARGDEKLAAHARYLDAPAADDPFHLDLRGSESFRRLYLEAEGDSGYIRDRNVFREGIDIYDQMTAIVRYRTGEILTYALTAYSPREGMRVVLNGDRGRIEYHEFTGSHMNRAVSSGDFQHEQHGSAEAAGEHIRVYPHFAPSYEVPMPPASGPHGGADAVLHEHLFAATPPADPWRRHAGHEQGAASVMVGVAANASIKTGLPVRLLDLAPLAPAALHLSELA